MRADEAFEQNLVGALVGDAADAAGAGAGRVGTQYFEGAVRVT